LLWRPRLAAETETGRHRQFQIVACAVAARPEIAIGLSSARGGSTAQTARSTPAFYPRPLQQPLSAARSSGLAPWACCAAVGWPCICFCASCEDAATLSAARFIVLVGGCSFASAAVPVVVWPVPTDAGPEPASFRFAARPAVSQGPAIAVLTLKTTMEQPARINRFVFICSSFASDVRPRRATDGREDGRETDSEAAGSGWPGESRCCLIGRSYCFRPGTTIWRGH
jgi:hypothetical protein